MIRLRFGYFWTIAALCVAACSSATFVTKGGEAIPPCSFTNPIAVGADPWVIRRGPYYYLAESRDHGIWIYRSTSLTSLKQNPKEVWVAPSRGWNTTNVWAPELHEINGRWYIYYAAGNSGPPFIRQHSGVLQSTSGDPQGTYIDRGMLYTGDDARTHTNNVWAIDLTVHKINDSLYALWSGWAQNASTDRTPQNLYIARMSDPVTIATNRVEIAAPVESWEVGTELGIEEGPEFLEHSGHEFIIYSTHESWLPDYRLGELQLISPTSDPLNPASWVKKGPVFTGIRKVYGVGHASFTTSPDSTEDWIVYHSKVDPAPDWNRDIRTQKFGWNPDGSPNFGIPAPAGQALSMPSGQCK